MSDSEGEVMGKRRVFFFVGYAIGLFGLVAVLQRLSVDHAGAILGAVGGAAIGLWLCHDLDVSRRDKGKP